MLYLQFVIVYNLLINTEFMKAKNLLLCVTTLIVSTSAMAQTHDYLDRNQIKALINSNGALFGHIFHQNFIPSFEVPKGMGLNSIEMANLWVAGIDEFGNVRGAASTYFQYEEYYFGPVADNYYSEQYKNTYNRVWKVDLSEIQYHLENFSQPGYEMPEAFLHWPAHGNTSNGEAADLAPYYDYNQNGIYDPIEGDCPAISGDQAVYFIFNEALGHHESGGSKMGLEFHGMAYCFNPSIGSTLTQTIFINYKIINRSSQDYTDFYAGMWCDFSLGFNDDDTFGSDSINQMMYVFNSNNTDPLYGAPAPVQGVILLNSEIKAAIPLDCCGPEDSVAYNNLRGLSTSGGEYHYGGVPEGYPTTYYYTGYPELGTGWIARNSYSGDFYGFNVRGIISSGPYNFKSDQSICLDFAFPYARDLPGTHLTAIALLREKAAAILRFFNDNEFNCNNGQSGIYHELVEKHDFNIFPNPSSGIVNVNLTAIGEVEKKISVISSDGKMLKTITTSEDGLELDFPEKGVYIIVVETDAASFNRKLIVL